MTQTRDRSSTRSRTRQAILDAAVHVLGSSQSASMAEIAEAADIARSTVHRYFPERADLLAALETYANERMAAANTLARLGEGTGAEALLRLCHHYFEDADLVMVAYGHLSTADELAAMDETDEYLAQIVERGHADGSIDPDTPALWVQQLLWSMIYPAWLMAKAGRVSRHEALTLFLDAFGKVLAPPA